MVNGSLQLHWLYENAGHKPPVPPGPLTCAVCGLPHGDGTPVASVFRPTFVDYDLLRMPHADSVCAACTWYFSTKLRVYSWYLTETSAMPMTRDTALFLLLVHTASKGPKEDSYYILSANPRHHSILRAEMTHAKTYPVVAWGTEVVRTTAAFPLIVAAMSALRRHHSWEEIEGDEYSTHALAEWPSLLAFRRARDVAVSHVGTGEWRLARYLYSQPLEGLERLMGLWD